MNFLGLHKVAHARRLCFKKKGPFKKAFFDRYQWSRENLAKLHPVPEILIAETDVNLHITGRVQFRTGSTFHMCLRPGFWITSSKQLAIEGAQSEICVWSSVRVCVWNAHDISERCSFISFVLPVLKKHKTETEDSVAVSQLSHSRSFCAHS